MQTKKRPQIKAEDFCSIYLTHPNLEQAKELSKILVQENLIGCSNIIPKVNSIYIWENELCEDEEVILFLKTKLELFDKCKQKILSLHPYDNPAIIALPFKNGHVEYLDWLTKQTI
ncbi:MAG: divalent-cation tolerance protein CutA [Bacteriovoracaceae bacterium]